MPLTSTGSTTRGVRRIGRTRHLRITIALGGNAILKRGERGTAEEQLSSVRKTVKRLVRLIEEGDRIVVTHGNGPQVGDILLRNELASTAVPPMPLDFCGAESQGMIGYMLQQAFEDELSRRKGRMPVVTVLTQTLVDASDPAFLAPTKPIGPTYTEKRAARMVREHGWKMARDGKSGYRRVVPSPEPVEVLEKQMIADLFNSGVIVIAAGGGGVPVIRTAGGKLKGVEAVVDKDRTASLLATSLGTEVLLILTDVEGLFLDFNKPTRRLVKKVDVGTLEKWQQLGMFPSGSMGPKVESAIRFIRDGGKRAIICSLESAEDAIRGRAGTTILSRLDSQR